MVPELVREHVRLRELARRAEPIAQLVVEARGRCRPSRRVGSRTGRSQFPPARTPTARHRGRARASRRATARRSWGRIFAQVCCASSSTNDTNCTSRCSAGVSLVGGAEASPEAVVVVAPPLSPKRVKRLRWKIRLRTSTMIVPPMPKWRPPNPPPPPLSPRRSSMFELSPPGVHRIAALCRSGRPRGKQEVGRGQSFQTTSTVASVALPSTMTWRFAWS